MLAHCNSFPVYCNTFRGLIYDIHAWGSATATGTRSTTCLVISQVVLLATCLVTPPERTPILEENTYSVDKSGFWPACGTQEWVTGAAGKKVQHQQKGRDQENTTVVVTICANGTSLPPAVIFNGQAFQMEWHQKNPPQTLYVLVPIMLTTTDCCT